MRDPSDPPGHPPDPAVVRARRLFRGTLAGTLGVRLLLAWSFPVIGDEAYLFTWARDLSWGYYDHPPLAAWLLHPFFALGLDAPFFLRLPSVALYALLSLVLVRLLRRFDSEGGGGGGEARAWLAGALFLLLPVHVVGVLMLTDVVLVLFVGLAGAAHFRTVALRDDAPAGYALAGALLGMALLTKYLAALLAAAFAVWFALSWRGGSPRRRAAGFALLVACAVPFVALHLWWNASHCWSTVLFNFVSRHAGESKNYSVPGNLLFFALAHLWVLGPPVLWYLLRPKGIARRLAELRRLARSDAFRPAALSFLVPTALLALSAATLLFGAYWILPFALFFFLVVPRVLEVRELRRSVAFLALFSGLHAAALAVALALPLSAFREAGFHDSLVTMERTGEILAEVEALAPGAHLVAPGYSFASLLSYRLGRPVPVLGEGSHYGRQDDLSTDFRSFDGDDVVMVGKRPVPAEGFDRWFEGVERRELEVEGVTLHAAVGRGFRFDAYRRDVLAPIRDRWYRPPAFLPDCGCPFLERYFPDGEGASGTTSAI
jgi:4-amino-4-deoxy-L-arabinose transferase-like glycosyltransferase